MRSVIFALATLTLAIYSSALHATPDSEQSLQQHINALLQTPAGQPGSVVRTAKLLATPQQIAALCSAPELSLIGQDLRLTGKRTVLARCGARKHYLPIRISAVGTWWIASRSLSSGTLIQPQDIQPLSGNLDGQPGGLLFDPAAAIGQRLTRAVAAGKPLLENQLRQQWMLRSGQTVDLVTQGGGFRIRSQGKALSNAAVDDTLRVQTRSGQTVRGKVAANGQVMIFLQQ